VENSGWCDAALVDEIRDDILNIMKTVMPGASSSLVPGKLGALCNELVLDVMRSHIGKMAVGMEYIAQATCDGGLSQLGTWQGLAENSSARRLCVAASAIGNGWEQLSGVLAAPAIQGMGSVVILSKVLKTLMLAGENVLLAAAGSVDVNEAKVFVKLMTDLLDVDLVDEAKPMFSPVR
jgi:hypothetical protein